MKSLEEMLQMTVPSATPSLDDSVETSSTSTEHNNHVGEIITDDEQSDESIPEYIYTDPQIVGFPDTETQEAIYNLALTGTIPFVGYTKILDIGSGRGDLAKHIAFRYQALSFEYTGYETNSLLANVGNEILLDEKFKIINQDFLSADITDEKFDQVFLIGTLNINYGWQNDWDQLELMLRKSIDICNNSVTFILLHDNGGNDEYISYAIPNLTDLVLKFNYPFSIDYGKIAGVYKLTINKKLIY